MKSTKGRCLGLLYWKGTMKKQKPITLDRREIRKSVRKPMPRPAQEHDDKRRKLIEKQREAEQTIERE